MTETAYRSTPPKSEQRFEERTSGSMSNPKNAPNKLYNGKNHFLFLLIKGFFSKHRDSYGKTALFWPYHIPLSVLGKNSTRPAYPLDFVSSGVQLPND